jgi:predicted amidophosphoribosyltransferase
MALQVDEASETYERAMRNIAAAGPGICRVCRGFNDPDYETCFKCGHRPDSLDAMVPITYSEHLGQMHLALRNYKDANRASIRRHDAIRLAAILWRFLRDHESCVAHAAGVDSFDLVTIVPSSSPERDKHSAFAELTGWIEPIKSRLRRTLEPTGEAEGREFDANRFKPTAEPPGESVLLLDDTWASGGHAQSAAYALRAAGAQQVALVVIGRHVRRDFEPVQGSGETCGDILDALPTDFDWTTCAVHDGGQLASGIEQLA